MLLISVRPYLSDLPGDHVSFPSGSQCLVEVIGLSQSGLDQSRLPDENLSRSVANTMSTQLLHVHLSHRQLVTSRVQLHLSD